MTWFPHTPDDERNVEPQQVDIMSASFRLLHSTPGHSTYGVWINGGKCGDLTVRVGEQAGLVQKLKLAGFVDTSGGSRPDQIW